jgi:hypothetical protein
VRCCSTVSAANAASLWPLWPAGPARPAPTRPPADRAAHSPSRDPVGHAQPTSGSVGQADPARPLPAGLSFGAPSVTIGTTLPSALTGIELRIPVWEQFLGAGDATVSLSLSPRSTPFAGTTIVETFLDATLCVRFDANLGAVALLLLGTILTGGLLFALVSPVIMISGAIVGAVAGIVLARVAGGIGTQVTQAQLGTIEPPEEDKRISCGPLNQATGCWTCSIHTDQETLLGRVALAQVVTHPSGVAIVWALPPVAEPALASVASPQAPGTTARPRAGRSIPSQSRRSWCATTVGCRSSSVPPRSTSLPVRT